MFVESSRKQFSTSNCISSLSFHPKLANILAAGTVSGELILWSVQIDDQTPNAADNLVTEHVIAHISNGHKEAITCLKWPVDLDVQKTVLLASSSLDGCISVWRLDLSQSTNALTKKTRFESERWNDSRLISPFSDSKSKRLY